MQDKDQKLIWESYSNRTPVSKPKFTSKERDRLMGMDRQTPKPIKVHVKKEENDDQVTGRADQGYSTPGSISTDAVDYPDVMENARFEEDYLSEFPKAGKIYDSIIPGEYDEGPEEFVVVTLGLKDNDDLIVLIPDTEKGFYCEDGSKNCYPISDQDAKTLLRSEVTYIYDYARAKAENNPAKYSKTVSIPQEVAKVEEEIMANHYTDGDVHTMRNNYYNYGGPNRDAGSWDPGDFR